MSRPMKERKVCCLPRARSFGPLGDGEEDASDDGKTVCLQVDEYETVRLIDLNGCTQEECAVQMNIARSTVQMIYNEARRKMADALVNVKILIIEGGSYRLCDGTDCRKRGKKRCCVRIQEEAAYEESIQERNQKNE